MAERRPMGALEAEVLDVLWRADGPVTPADVRTAMGTDLAYTTVMTILVRLWEKGLTERTKLIAITHMSNALGTVVPIKEVCRIAHERGIPVMVDGFANLEPTRR